MRFEARWGVFALLLASGVAPAEELEKLIKACKGASCTKLGQRIEKGEFLKLGANGYVTPETRKRLSELYKRACADGDGAGCWHWGIATTDDEEETRAMELACNLRVDDACIDFAVRLINGELLAADPGRAAKLLEPLCAKKQLEACGILGGVLIRGEGVKQDISRGLKLLDDACQAGEEVPCENARRVRARLKSR